MGKLRSENKSDLLNNLYELCETQDSRAAINGIIIEGSVLVKAYRTTRQIIFTAYFEESLKMTAHQTRGDGSRMKVTTDSAIFSRKWDIF